jgi:hypothetical protein
MPLKQYFFIVYFSIIVISTLVGISRLKQLNKSSKLLLLLLILTLFSESLANYLRFNSIPNTWIYHVFMPIEFVVLGLMYYTEFKKKIVIFLIIAFVTLSIINSLFIQNYNEVFNSYTFIVYCILSLILSLIFLYLLITSKTQEVFTQFPLFWISIAFSIFNIINLFLLGTHNTLTGQYESIDRIFSNIRFFSNYLLYLLFIPAFLCK